MIEDLVISLPAGKEQRVLQVTSDQTKYNELLQRAVTLLLTSDLDEFRIDGMSFLERVTNATSAGINALSALSGQYAEALMTALNSEGVEVDSVELVVSGDTEVLVTIDISAANSDNTANGEFTII